jgi:hypothetical protein
MRSRTLKKPKSKKVPAEGGAAAGPSKGPAANEDGTKDHPISLLDEKANKKRKNYTVIEENGKKRKVVDIVRLVYPNQFPLYSLPLARLPS